DEAAGVAEVTCRIDGRTEVVEMPLAEVARRVSSGPALILDNLNGPESARRILEQQDGWYFAAREGRMGPFDSRKTASRALARYILSMQTADDTRREPLRSSGSRHGERDRRRQPAASGQPA